jgi:hypothetical protein
MANDKLTREAIRAFEEKMRTEGADGFAAGPHPWESWDVSGNAEGDDRIWDNSALHDGARKRTRPGPGERLLNGLAMLALLALLVGIGGVYFSEEPDPTIAQQGVQPLPIIRKPLPAPATVPMHRPSVQPVPPTGMTQHMPAAAAAAPESFAEAPPPTPVMEVPASDGSPTSPVPASPLGAQTDANIAMANAGEPPVIGVPSSVVAAVPANTPDIAEAETPQAREAPQAAEAVRVPPTAEDMPLSAASSILDEAPDTAEPETPQVPEAVPVPPTAEDMPLSAASSVPVEAPEIAEPETPQAPKAVPEAPTADGMPLSAASSVPDEAPDAAEPETPRTPAATPAPASTRPPAPELETATAPPAEQTTAAVAEAPSPAAVAASPPVEAATPPPGDATTAADNAATPQPAPVAVEPVAPARQPDVARNSNIAALMPADASGGWAVNLVSYTHETAARRTLKEYRDEGVDAEIQTVILNDKPMYRVRIVGYDSRPAAQAQIDPLQKLLDLESVWVSRR